MADNLQDFLRKAAERRAQQQGGAPVQPPAQPPAQPPSPKSLPPTSRQQAPLAPPDMEVYDTEPVSPDDVIQHVEEHLDNSRFARRAATLGSDLSEQQEERLHDVFDHKVGELSKESVTDDVYERKDADRDYMVDDKDYFEETKKTQRPDLIGDLFRSPQSIVQAFIFSEIIKPPVDRWEE